MTVHNLPGVLEGDLDPLIDALVMADQADRLARRSTEGRRSPPDDRAADVRFIEPRVRPIVRATDLGSRPGPQARQPVPADRPVRRHPPRFARARACTHGDTRLLSCSVLRVNGERPVAAPGLGGRQLPRHDPADQPARRPQPGRQVHPDDALAGQTLGIARDRLIGGGALEERVRIVNYATEHAEPSRSSWSSGADAADIFEVRGYPRAERGTLLPSPCRRTGSRSATTAWTACGGARTSRSPSRRESVEAAAMPADALDDGGRRSRLRWQLGLAAARPRRARAGRSGRTTRRDRPPDATAEPDAATLFPAAPRVDRATRARPPTAPGSAAPRPIAHRQRAVQPRRSQRSVADLRLLRQRRPGPGERYLAAGVPWFATLFGRDSIIAALQALAVPAAARGRDARACWPPTRRPRSTTGARRRARQDPPRAADRRDGAAPASCRTRPTTAPSTRRRCG